MPAVVDAEKCGGCGSCAENCPSDAIEIVDGLAVVDEDACLDCALCEDECPHDAIKVG